MVKAPEAIDLIASKPNEQKGRVRCPWPATERDFSHDHVQRPRHCRDAGADSQLQEQIRTHEVAIAELREKETELQTIVSTLQEMEKFMRESGGAAWLSPAHLKPGAVSAHVKKWGRNSAPVGAFWRGCSGIDE